MFSTFPDGWPGVGLLLLRATCGGLLTIQGLAYLLASQSGRLADAVAACLAIATGILLLSGCLTRVAASVATVACASSIFSWLSVAGMDVFGGKLPSMLIAVIAASIFCLGPGAFSLDAYFFGRREVVIPRHT